jgi:hypothetical protein
VTTSSADRVRPPTRLTDNHEEPGRSRWRTAVCVTAWVWCVLASVAGVVLLMIRPRLGGHDTAGSAFNATNATAE